MSNEALFLFGIIAPLVMAFGANALIKWRERDDVGAGYIEVRRLERAADRAWNDDLVHDGSPDGGRSGRNQHVGEVVS